MEDEELPVHLFQTGRLTMDFGDHERREATRRERDMLRDIETTTLRAKVASLEVRLKKLETRLSGLESRSHGGSY